MTLLMQDETIKQRICTLEGKVDVLLALNVVSILAIVFVR